MTFSTRNEARRTCWARLYAAVVVAVTLWTQEVEARPPKLGELDVIREQHRTPLGPELARTELALEIETEPREMIRLRLVRTRLWRLRGEYTCAKAELKSIAQDIPADLFELRAWLWFEGLELEFERYRWFGMVPSLSPAESLDNIKTYAALGKGLHALEHERILATQGPAPKPDDPLVFEPKLNPEHRSAADDVMYIHQVQGLAVALAALDALAPGEDMTMNMIVSSMSATVPLGLRETGAIFSAEQRASLLRAKPRLKPGKLLDNPCLSTNGPHEAAYCAEWLLFRGSSITLGLGDETSHDIDVGWVADDLALSAEVEMRALALLEQARAKFESERALASLAWVESLRASNELRALVAGEREDTDAVLRRLERARGLASSSGDLRLELALRAHEAFVASLAHASDDADARLGHVIDHIGIHHDVWLSTQLAGTASALARAALQRADLVSTEILLRLAANLRAAARAQMMATATHIELAAMSSSGGADTWARELFEVAEAQLASATSHELSVPDTTLRMFLLLELARWHIASFDATALRHVVTQMQDLATDMSPGLTDEEQLARVEVRAAKEHTAYMQRELPRLFEHALGSTRRRSFPPVRTVRDLNDRLEFLERGPSALEEFVAPLMTSTRDWQWASTVRFVRSSTNEAQIELALMEEHDAILRDPDRPAAALAERLAPWRESLRLHRPDILAKIMVEAGQRERAIDLLRQPPAWKDPNLTLAAKSLAYHWLPGLGSVADLPIGFLPGILASRWHLRFRALVELEAYNAAAEVRFQGASPLRPNWAFDASVQWSVKAAKIRYLHARKGPEVAAHTSSEIRDELLEAETLGDPRLRRGMLLQQGFIDAVSAAVDVELARGELTEAAELILRARPSGAAYISRGGDTELANLITQHDVLMGQRDSRGCTDECTAKLNDRIKAVRRSFEARVPPLTSGAPLPDLDNLDLAENTAILTHLVSLNAVHILLLRSGSPPLIARREVESVRLRGRVHRLGSELGRGLSEGHIATDLEHLAAALLPDPSALEDIDNLVVVPHDIITDVPFALLPWGQGQLLDAVDIVEAPGLEFISHSRAPARRLRSIRARVLVADDTSLAKAEREARAVQRLLRAGLVKDADSQQFERALHDGLDLLHVVAHGERAGEGQPGALLLSGAEGRYRADDILIIPGALSAKAVVFSACEVGIARGSPSDDGFLLGPALLRRGVQEVLVPLWDVWDTKKTVRFWRWFYRAYRRSGSLASALASTQRRARGVLEPQYWAGYKVISHIPQRARK